MKILTIDLSGICHVPTSPLQPNSPTREIALPMDGRVEPHLVTLASEDTYSTLFDASSNTWFLRDWSTGQPTSPTWRAPNGEWTSGTWEMWESVRNQLPTHRQVLKVQLPALPTPPSNPVALPKRIHYLWIGNQMPPTSMIECVANNCRLSSDYLSTLHVDVERALLPRLREAFSGAAPTLSILPLEEGDFSPRFKQSDNFAQYQQLRVGPGRNFAAACDVLRYPLVNHHAGIYLDMDDRLLVSLNDVELMAAPNDVLLGPLVIHHGAQFRGYNNSVFASHANNPVLSAVSREMHRRYLGNHDFFTKPKPRFDENGVLLNPEETDMSLSTYTRNLFHLTGPSLLNDVVAVERPDYYRLAFLDLKGLDVPSTHHVWDEEHDKQLNALKEHYFPFDTVAPVEIGQAHTWMER